MKLHFVKIAAFAFSFIPATGYSQYAYSQNSTFALTVTIPLPTLTARDPEGRVLTGQDLKYKNEYTTTKGTIETNVVESGSKMAPFKISNREILEELVSDGVIGSITGYSITLYTIDNETEEADTFAYYLTKKGATPINITDKISFGPTESEAISATFNERSVTTTNSVTAASLTTYTKTASVKGLYGLNINAGEISVYGNSIFTFSEAYKILGRGAERYGSEVPGASKLGGIIGYISPNDQVNFVVEGTISHSAGVPISLPPAP
jgi:hypothetical protein